MRRIVFPREVLLVEIERRCAGPSCGARARFALTKAEAVAYTGFECLRCGLWCADALAEQDVPDWWEELKITGLEGVRPRSGAGSARVEPGEVVERMSDAWQRLARGGARSGVAGAVGVEDESGGETF